MTSDLFREAYGAMQHNRRRTTLTMLGMAWGIATVVILLAFGSGFERAISMIFSSWGTDVIGAFPGRTSLQAGGTKAGSEVRLKLADVDYIRNEVPMIKGVTPIFDKQNGVTIQHDTRTYTNLFLTGVFPVYERIRGFGVATGRGLGEQDLAEHARVAVIGDEAKRRLFSGQPAIGQNIRINGVTFQVIGVYQHKVQGGDNNDNTMIVIPFSTMGDLYDTQYITGLFMDYEGQDHQQLARVVRSVLAGHHNFRPDDRRAVFIADFKQDFDDFTVVTAALKILLAFIGALTLGIGGIGLMNIMLVSVQQRTREIGVEKALGAQKSHILLQFLVGSAGHHFRRRRRRNRDRLSDFLGCRRPASHERLRRQPASGRHSPANQSRKPSSRHDNPQRSRRLEWNAASDPGSPPGSNRKPPLRIVPPMRSAGASPAVPGAPRPRP